jgi:aspartate/methionine/tyrosine aminotransferase
LPSLRVGWLSGHRHLVRPCALTASLSAPFVPTVCQQLAIALLKQDDESFAPVRAEFDGRRRYVHERLQALKLPAALPAGGFFFWVSVAGLGVSGRAFAEKLLRAKRVLVGPGEPFGPGGGDFIRLSYATDDGRLREGLTRLGEFVGELRGATGEGSSPDPPAEPIPPREMQVA